jgi:hypothetical protein
MADMAYSLKKYGPSARLYAEVFRSDPKRAEDMDAGNRYNAACSAALAGCGKSKDDPPPDQVAQAGLRQRALDWLEEDLAFWTELQRTLGQARPLITQTLQHWKTDSDLAGIRDAEALKRLPEDEQKAWRTFWSNVDSILGRAR